MKPICFSPSFAAKVEPASANSLGLCLTGQDTWRVGSMNSHLYSDLKSPNTLWCAIHTHTHTHGSKNAVQFIRTQSPWKCQTSPAGSRKLAVCVCVCQSASLSTCLCICVWVCLKEPGVTEKSGFFFNNRGIIFVNPAQVSISCINVLFTNFSNMVDIDNPVN